MKINLKENTTIIVIATNIIMFIIIISTIVVLLQIIIIVTTLNTVPTRSRIIIFIFQQIEIDLIEGRRRGDVERKWLEGAEHGSSAT